MVLFAIFWSTAVGMSDGRRNGRVDDVESVDAGEHTPADEPRGRASAIASTRDAKRFGKYQLLTELGRGGMATVYLAVAHAGIQDVRKLVVIKLLNENLRTDAEFVDMFAREARIAAELSHPNIVLTHTVGQEEGRYYIAMEYLEGVTLREIMRYSSDWPLQDRLPLFGAMCLALTGLGYVHDFHDHRGKYLGLIHRDVKPDNIFITTTGQVKLLDFGVTKANSIGFEPTLGLAVRGTIQYLPPEATKADAEVDLRWDLFSAGVILAELATGRRFWNGLPPVQILTRLAADDLPTPTLEREEEVSPPLARLLERALQPDPIARYQTALELRKAIQGFLTRQGYKVGTADLARIVGHLFEPIRQQRENVIRAGLEAMDRARPPSGTYMAQDSGEHEVATPVRLEDTAPVVHFGEPSSSSGPSRAKLWLVAAVLLSASLPVGWLLLRDPAVSAPAPAPIATTQAPAAPTAARPDAAPTTPAVVVPSPATATAPATPPAPAAAPEPAMAEVATPEPAGDTAAQSVPLPTEEPRTKTDATTTPDRGPARPPRPARARKGKERPAAAKTDDTANDDASTPSKPASGKKVELEPSPYTR